MPFCGLRAETFWVATTRLTLLPGLSQIARENGLRRADDHTRRFKAHLDPMRAEITFGRSVAVGIDIEGIVRTSLHASFATNAAPVVEINDTVRAAIQRASRTNYCAWRIVAVVAPHDPEVARGVREFALFDVLDPGPEYSDGHLMFLFARDRAGVTPDTPVLIDDESVAHLLPFALLAHTRKRLQLRHHS